jgi:hypothetical protein
MIETIKSNIMAKVAVVAVALLFAFAVPAAVSAQTEPEIDSNVKCGSNIGGLEGGVTDASECTDVEGSGSSIENLIRTIINVFSVIVGSISVIMIIVGGFRYITSAGDSNNVSGAKNTILYAIVGLVIVAFAQIIVQFVLQRTVTD